MKLSIPRFGYYKWTVAVTFIAFVVVSASSFYIYHIEHSLEHVESNIPKAGSLLVDIAESITDGHSEQIICYRESHRNFYFFVFYVLLAMIGLITYGSYAQSRYSKKLKELNKEIKRKADELSLVNDELYSGLRYAGIIQKAFFPSEAERLLISPHIKFHFEPKESVSGDFIWMRKINDCKVICMGDCTGHGVGAGLLTIACIDLLNKYVPMYPYSPAQVLNTFRVELKSMLKDTEIEEALTLAICVIKDNKLIISASRQDAFLVDGHGNIKELKGSRQGLSHYFADEPTPFENIEMPICPQCKLILFTDGFTDQFGGPEGKKLTKKGLKNWLAELHCNPSGPSLYERWCTWRGAYAQVDDMALMEIML